MTNYTAITDADRLEMLEAIGVSSIEDLFADIPRALRLAHGLELDAGRSEQEVYAELRELAARNVSTEDELSFVLAELLVESDHNGTGMTSRSVLSTPSPAGALPHTALSTALA